MIKEAAVMLVLNEGLILAVSRRHNPNKYGLPGGKVEDLELPWYAAIRETKEETGIEVKYSTQIYTRTEPAESPAGQDFVVYCYYALEWLGTPQDSNEGHVKWMSVKDLTSAEHGAFPIYNQNTIEAFKKIFPNIKVL
jgi:ADP-ribose pyrophosphatase YjhB (NUDIX family)